jgi:hypothetical protein
MLLLQPELLTMEAAFTRYEKLNHQRLSFDCVPSDMADRRAGAGA